NQKYIKIEHFHQLVTLIPSFNIIPIIHNIPHFRIILKPIHTFSKHTE
ncbi:hypothetical protein M153_60120003, partial [Pseudoloma neurophilia]